MADETAAARLPQNPANDTECPICRKAFSRVEHLKRHIATHTLEKPYSCQWCTKRFARKDAAQRHQSAHVPDGSPIPEGSKAAIHLTCTECAQAHLQCSGLEPCQSCKRSGLQCMYPTQKKRRRVLSDAEEQHGYEPSTLLEQGASEALAPEQQLHHARPSLSLAVADAEFNPPATSGSERATNFWHSQPFNAAASNNMQVRKGGIYPDEALISAIMDATWRWEGTNSLSGEHVDHGQANSVAGGRYFMPTGDTSLGLPGSDINWLPLEHVSDLYFESINATALGSEITVPFLPSQGPPGLLPTSKIQQSESVLPVADSSQASPAASVAFQIGQPATSNSQNIDGLAQDEIENARAPRRKRSLYVDGAGSRSTRAERNQPRKRSFASSSKPPLQDSIFSPRTPDSALHEILDDQVQRIRYQKRTQMSITLQTYKEIIFKLENTVSCFSSTLHPFHPDRFLSIETLDWFVRLYFENFNPVYSFLDKSLLSVPAWGCCITLATAAIGATYMTSPEGATCSDALHGLLHEILTQEYDLHGTEESLVYVQARALNVIGLCNSHQKRLMELGYKSIDIVSAACSRLGLLDEIPHTSQSQTEDLEHAWISWRVRESRRRTGLFIWMLDCILAYTASSSAQFSRSSLKLRLPSSEALWDATSSQVWQNTKEKYPEPEYFQRALQVLYIERRLVPQISEFGSIILIHGLIHRTWDVARSLEDSLSLWTPSATSNRQLPPQPELAHKYLPTVPDFSRWRNSACDCLDVLHWEALGASAKAGGLEGSKFLKLHLARSVLLTPVTELEGLVNALSSPSQLSPLPHDRTSSHQSFHHCYKIVRIWAERDKYKARLAVVHAAATFWHVRRFSSDSFVQPFAVFLATSVLWAYSAFSQRRKQRKGRSTEPLTTEQSVSLAAPDGKEDGPAIEGTNDGAEENHAHLPPQSRPSSPDVPDFMHLDRPFDDEIGQRFIRDGDNMRVFMEGVGELCHESGPQLVLREGARIVRNRCGTWTIAENYASVLEAVASNPQAKML